MADRQDDSTSTTVFSALLDFVSFSLYRVERGSIELQQRWYDEEDVEDECVASKLTFGDF